MSASNADKSLVDLGHCNTLALSDAVSLTERVASATVELCYIDPPLFPKVGDTPTKERARTMRGAPPRVGESPATSAQMLDRNRERFRSIKSWRNTPQETLSK